MEYLGFSTTWLLPNFDSFIIFIGQYPLMMLYLLLLHIITKYCSKSCKKRRYSMSGQVFWNWPMKFLVDSYIVIQICCLYCFKYRQWKNKESIINSALSITLLTLMLLYPLLTYLFLNSRRKLLTTK